MRSRLFTLPLLHPDLSVAKLGLNRRREPSYRQTAIDKDIEDDVPPWVRTPLRGASLRYARGRPHRGTVADPCPDWVDP
jgi:hypothetical protein